jgi:hypothetical protein
VNLFRTFSDADLYIRKVDTDEIYEEAIDIEGALYSYEETNEPIEAYIEEDGVNNLTNE